MLFDFLDFNRDGELDFTEKWLGLMMLDELMTEEQEEKEARGDEDSFSEEA